MSQYDFFKNFLWMPNEKRKLCDVSQFINFKFVDLNYYFFKCDTVSKCIVQLFNNMHFNEYICTLILNYGCKCKTK